MRILRKLYVSMHGFPRPDRSECMFRSRYVCTFVERALKQERLRCQASTLNVTLSHESRPCKWTDGHVLSVYVPAGFDRFSDVDSGNLVEISGLFLDRLRRGWDLAATEIELPLDVMKRSLLEFEAGGYVNKWELKRKRISKGMQVVLSGELDPWEFRGKLVFCANGRVLKEHVVVQELPDETIFKGLVHGLAVRDDRVLVLDKFGDRVASVPVPIDVSA